MAYGARVVEGVLMNVRISCCLLGFGLIHLVNGEEGVVPRCDLGLKSIFYLETDFLIFEQRFQKASEYIFSQRPLRQTQHINPRDTSSAAPHSPADLHIRTYLVDGKVPSLPPSTIRVFPLQ